MASSRCHDRLGRGTGGTHDPPILFKMESQTVDTYDMGFIHSCSLVDLLVPTVVGILNGFFQYKELFYGMPFRIT